MIQYILGLFQAVISGPMSYITARFFLMVFALTIFYYLLPLKFRWCVLLLGSGYFYFRITASSKQLIVIALSIIVSYSAGLLIVKFQEKKSGSPISLLFLWLGILFSAFPLIASKCGSFLDNTLHRLPTVSWIVPIGLSFYSMQIISYLVDIYKGEIIPERNLLKYTLYVSFFPTIIQGPISRYKQLGRQLFEGHRYDHDKTVDSLMLILWGLFLKYLIADKASVIVNAIFDDYQSYTGLYILIAAILYSIQLYTDFLSCVTISQGVAGLFGINLIDNFKRPYFATSVKDFWRRWHISLSSWLRDYIYIPLGGNRKGTLRKYINLVITFLVSGLWHGESLKYLLWGLLHSIYQILGETLTVPKNYLFNKLSFPKDSRITKIISTVFTFFLVMIAWIIFRASNLKAGIHMLISMFTSFNPWILFDKSLYRLGLSQNEFNVLFVAILILLVVSVLQEKGIRIRSLIKSQNMAVRCAVYLVTIWIIWIFGTYGKGFDASGFIYGGF